jgi:hypothetical protein
MLRGPLADPQSKGHFRGMRPSRSVISGCGRLMTPSPGKRGEP